MPCTSFRLGEAGPPEMGEFDITDVNIQPAQQSPGQAVSIVATFHNRLDYAITAPYQVIVGTQIPGQPQENQTIAQLTTVLEAGETKQVNLGWTIPYFWQIGEDHWVCVEHWYH